MAISKIKSGSLTDSSVTTDKLNNDAITTAKLASGSITSADVSADIITGQTELSETAADTDYTLIYDTSTSSLKKILRSNIVLTAPTITSISPTTIDSAAGGNETFTITGTNFTTGSTARLISANGQIKEFSSVTRNSTTQITGIISKSSLPGGSLSPYSVQVTSGSGVSSLLANQINSDATPTFVTASGSLGTQRSGSFSATVEATDPDSAGVVTYDLYSGTLPTGITLNSSTGVISGTITPETSDTTYNFTIRATDVTSNTSTRAFSITLLGPSYTSFTSSGTFSVPSGITSVNVLVVAGAGGGGRGGGRVGPPGDNGSGAGGGGAGGLIFRPGFPVTPGGTVSVTVGNGGGCASAGQDSVFGTLTAKGGGGGGPGNKGAGQSGGSGGGGGGGQGGTGPGGSATQPTQPGDSGTYGFGNNGGNGQGGDYQSGGGAGGGSGAAGSPSPGFAGGPGGIGKAYTIADGTTPVYYAGGGGGGGGHTGGGGDTPAPGGQGGGGAGGAAIGGSGTPGTANTGGGGGGGAQSPGGTCAGQGGKGIVIVQY